MGCSKIVWETYILLGLGLTSLKYIYTFLTPTHRTTHLVLQSLHVLLFQSMNMFIIIFALFAYLTKIFSSWSHHPTLFGVKSNSRAALILKLISTLLSFYTFPQKNKGFFGIHNFCFLLNICYESGSDILLGVGPTLGVIAVPNSPSPDPF